MNQPSRIKIMRRNQTTKKKKKGNEDLVVAPRSDASFSKCIRYTRDLRCERVLVHCMSAPPPPAYCPWAIQYDFYLE